MKGFGAADANLIEHLLHSHALRIACKDDTVRLYRNLRGHEDMGLQASRVNIGHRRTGRDVLRLARGVVQGIDALVLRNVQAHAGGRIEDDGTLLHDDEILIVKIIGRVQVQVDI